MIVPLLVLHHRYTKPVAFDLSQHKNHGALEGVGSVGGALVFGGGSDRVRVRSSSSLSDLRSVRAQVSFTWKPTAGGRRHNLIEGFPWFSPG